MGARERPSLWRWSSFAVTWQASLWLGWGLVLLAVVLLRTLELGDMTDATRTGYQLLMVTALVIFGELRPVIASDSYANDGVPISTAFVFATLYL